MEKLSGDDELLELPPGFRFHPTDEELITHYLSEKVVNSYFSAQAIGEVDLNKVEPWDLPSKAKLGEKEWYFFCVRDRKYPTGLRTNRATEAGYWKATGKDREIHKMKALIGMKKTLVFYKGRAPRGDKTNWVMHEFRVEGKNLPKSAKNEWVICRVFEKNPSLKNMEFSGLVRMNSFGDASRTSILPPLMDCSVYGDEGTKKTTRTTAVDASYVTCFSHQSEENGSKRETTNAFTNPLLPTSSSSNPLETSLFPKAAVQDSPYLPQFDPKFGFSHYSDSYHMQDPSILRCLIQRPDYSPETGGGSTDYSSVVSNHEMEQSCYDDQQDMISSGGPVDLGCLWNY